MSATDAGTAPEEPRYIQFPHLEAGATIDGKPALNRWSHFLTRGKYYAMAKDVRLITLIGHDFPGAQAMLYAAGVPNRDMMKNAPQVGYERFFILRMLSPSIVETGFRGCTRVEL